MKVNGSKKISLHQSPPIPSTIYLNSLLSKTKEFTKSLILIIDRKLTYKNYLNNAISKGQKTWNSIQRKCLRRLGPHLTLRRFFFSKPLSNRNSFMLPQFRNILNWKIYNSKRMALSACEVLLGVPRLETLFQSISSMLLTKLKQNQSDIVAEVYYNKLDHAQSTGHLESCLRRFEKVTINYPALVYSIQTVTAFINELWLRGLCSPDTFAVLRIFRNTMTDCHSKSHQSLGNPYLANRKRWIFFGNTLLFTDVKWRLSQFVSPLCMCGPGDAKLKTLLLLLPSMGPLQTTEHWRA